MQGQHIIRCHFLRWGVYPIILFGSCCFVPSNLRIAIPGICLIGFDFANSPMSPIPGMSTATQMNPSWAILAGLLPDVMPILWSTHLSTDTGCSLIFSWFPGSPKMTRTDPSPLDKLENGCDIGRC